MSGSRPSDVHIFRPYPDEVPWELLADSAARAQAPDIDLDLLRVAKHEGRVVGVYAIRPLAETCYELMTLVVDPSGRRRGIGRWLLGHAIGLAESKGAREIVTAGAGGSGERLLRRVGFEAHGGGLRLVLTPE